MRIDFSAKIPLVFNHQHLYWVFYIRKKQFTIKLWSSKTSWSPDSLNKVKIAIKSDCTGLLNSHFPKKNIWFHSFLQVFNRQFATSEKQNSKYFWDLYLCLKFFVDRKSKNLLVMLIFFDSQVEVSSWLPVVSYLSRS